MFKISEVQAIKKVANPLQLKEILNMSHTATLFSQTLSLIPRHVFQKLDARHKVGRSSRKFGFKEQFTAMAFIQLATRRSMRDGLRVLNAARKKLYHFGLSSVARSTFADANNYRPAGFFKDLFAEMYTLCAVTAPKHKFCFKCKLYSLDTTTISRCLSLFPWASFRQNKGYDSDAFVKSVKESGAEAVIPPRKGRKVQRPYDKHLYRVRHLVLNAIQQLKEWRGG